MLRVINPESKLFFNQILAIDFSTEYSVSD